MAKRPHFTVITSGGQNEIRYDANHLAYCHHEGRYCLSFVSSGGLVVLPVRDVLRVEFDGDPEQAMDWCGVCDQPLEGWPVNDPGFGDNPEHSHELCGN